MQQGKPVPAKISRKNPALSVRSESMGVGLSLAQNSFQSVPIAQSLSGGEQMFPHALSSGAPAAVLNMTTDFTPLFVGMVLLMSFCVLALAFAIAFHDTHEMQHGTEQEVTPHGDFPKAA